MRLHQDHDAAAIFPPCSGKDLAALAEDINVRGLLKPIWIDGTDGRILDGRARFRACQLVDVVPAFRIWQGAWCSEPESPVEFVLRQNLHLRQCKPTWLNLVGARIYRLPDGLRGGLTSGVQIAARLHISQTSLRRAIHVLTHGSAALIASVEQGQLLLPAADRIARLPLLDQAAALERQLRRPRPQQHPRRRPGVVVTAVPLPPAVKPSGKSPEAIAARQAARRQQLQQLADEGFNSEQIAAALSISRERVQQLLHKAGIVCYGDRVRSHFKPDANRILGHMVATAEDLVTDEALVNFTQLDPQQLPGWIATLATAHKSLGALITRLRQLRKETSPHDDSPEVHPTRLEDPTRAHRSASRAASLHHTAPVHPVPWQSPGERPGPE